MLKETAATSKGEKGKLAGWLPLRNTSMASTSLQQLKNNVESLPGIIKNTEDGLQHLVKKQWLLPKQTVMVAHLTAVLLSLITTKGPQTSTDKISDNVANIIKSVVFLLEEATIAQYTEKITNHLTSQPMTHSPTQINNKSTNHIKESLENLSKTIQDYSENAQRANEKLQVIQDSLSLTAMQTATNANFSYREALINSTVSHPPALQPPANIHKARLQNRLSIKAYQTLIEIQTQEGDPSVTPLHWTPMQLVKSKPPSTPGL